MSPRRLLLSRDADSFVRDLAGKQYKQILSRILDLTKDPMPHDGGRLQGFDGYRIDVGEFRVIYRFDDEDVCIVLVGKRNDDEVYRKLRRM